MKILVVDDDSSIRDFFWGFLAIEKHEVFFAVDGDEARGMIMSYKDVLDVIITDLRMPAAKGGLMRDNEGIELVRFARLRIGKGVRIILMSGDLTDIDAKIAQMAGADFIIAKPFQIGELRHILNSVKKNGG